MKFATASDGTPDGRLLVVSRDLSCAAPADDIAPNLLVAIERWDEVEAALKARYDEVHAGTARGICELDLNRLTAPLPRTWQWLDGSVFRTHLHLTVRAFGIPDVWCDQPLMYQGMSHRFLPPFADVEFPSHDDDIDFEGEFAVITGLVTMGTPAEHAGHSIRLITQINDWSLRQQGRNEAMRGFGWIHAKPACTMAPVIVTPDELGAAWRDFRCDLKLEIRRNGEIFGSANGREMAFGFDELIAHAAYSRELSAGTVLGSGTVSNAAYREVGSSCIIERRGIEIIDAGTPSTPFLDDGEWVSMRGVDADGVAPFGEMRSQVRIRDRTP
jgi:fumarylacetoacetate (FAA) hydrolase